MAASELEWKLSQSGAFKTSLNEAPRPAVRDVMESAIRGGGESDDVVRTLESEFFELVEGFELCNASAS